MCLYLRNISSLTHKRNLNFVPTQGPCSDLEHLPVCHILPLHTHHSDSGKESGSSSCNETKAAVERLLAETSDAT